MDQILKSVSNHQVYICASFHTYTLHICYILTYFILYNYKYYIIDVDNNQRIIVATGGDDNAFSVAYVDIDKNDQNKLSIKKYEKYIQEFAHASALTGNYIFKNYCIYMI